MLAIVHCGSLLGVDAHGVEVEISVVSGLPGFEIVGLPETAVRESRVRVLAAIENSGFALPPRKLVLNLAPADLRKGGTSFDLAIAVAALSASGSCAPNRLGQTLIVGELSLDGALKPVRGLLAQLRSARVRGLRAAVVPQANQAEASLATGLEIRCASHLREVIDYLNGLCTLPSPEPPAATTPGTIEDLSDVCGQHGAKRALEIAAAGMHNLLMIGPPGAGKTMLARRLRWLLPQPDREQALEIATIAGATGQPVPAPDTRPFRAPHHSASEVALVGGGDPVRAGEVTLAHRGVLFLDELPEFRPSALESLRPTMESGLAAIARSSYRVSLPARPLVVAAMNPCPCGYVGDPTRLCRCSGPRIERYRARLSGPLLDRFDLHVALPPVQLSSLASQAGGEASARVRARVVTAHQRAEARRRQTTCDSSRSGPQLSELSKQLQPSALELLRQGVEQLGLSLRGYVKAMRVARTIADLAGHDGVQSEDVAEALQYRLLDRSLATRPSPPETSPNARVGLGLHHKEKAHVVERTSTHGSGCGPSH